MNQSPVSSLTQGLLDLIIFSRLQETENIHLLLCQISEKLPIGKFNSKNLSDWFLKFLGVSTHYCTLAHIPGISENFKLTFRVADKDDEKVLFSEVWNISVGDAERKTLSEPERDVKGLVRNLLLVIRMLPLTAFLRSNRSFLKQCSIYYIISRSYNTRQRFGNKIQFEEDVCCRVVRIEIETSLIDRAVRCEKKEKEDVEMQGDFKRKESYSTMNSDENPALTQKDINELKYQKRSEGENIVWFEEDQESDVNNLSDNSFVSIELDDSEEEAEVIQEEEPAHLKQFRQKLAQIGEVEIPE